MDVNDGSGVNFAICYVPRFDEVTQPLSCVRFNFIIIGRHHGAGGFSACARSATSCDGRSPDSMLVAPNFPYPAMSSQ